MSNVKKNQRSEITPVKFKYELDLISDKIIQFLIRDFGVAELSPNLKIFTNNAKMVEEDVETLRNLVTNYNLAIENNYQYWLVEEFRRQVLTCLDNVLTDVDYAYSMYPTTVYDAIGVMKLYSFSNNTATNNINVDVPSGIYLATICRSSYNRVDAFLLCYLGGSVGTSYIKCTKIAESTDNVFNITTQVHNTYLGFNFLYSSTASLSGYAIKLK